ncbi:Putative disease resistance protein RGA1 [Linum grandiflorum]
MRFLLVLDDVWEDSHSKWEELLTALSCNSLGSKILVTTRKGEVSRALCCIEDDVLLIGKVPEDVCQAIFTEIAFHGWNANEKERVEGFCKDAVIKCDGSPLAAKVLGGVMQFKKSKSEWLKVLKSEMWHLNEVRKEVFGPLALSYYDLTPEIRQCFQFCAVFPKDCEMEKAQLIKLWISQGFVGARENQEVEDIGEEYFQILARRSLFQDFSKPKYLGEMEKTYCKMHDLVHDFAQMLSKGECASMTGKGMRDVTAISINGNAVRNLRMDFASSWDFTINSSHLFFMKDLRSFMANKFLFMESDVWGHLCGIRSLVLINSRLDKIPSTINQLIHMRHLDLSLNHYLNELPEEICELYNLWTLKINRCLNLKRLLLGMGNKLVNLKHLENEGVYAPVPKSIRRLTRLKTLRMFVIDKDQPEGGASIADLKDMNQLQGSLYVNSLSNVAESYEVEQADFASKTAVTCLELGFYKTESSYDDDKDEELFEAVRPSTNLEELIIRRYMGASVFPRWMVSLSNLTRLSFYGCYKVQYLPHLGGLPSLEELLFCHMDEVKKVGVELLLGHEQQQQCPDVKAFPRLTVLKFQWMKEWEEWDDTMLSSPSVMPRLSCLNLYNCKRLKKLPDAILQKQTLERLDVDACNSLESFRNWEADKNEPPEVVLSHVWHKISHIPTIIFDNFKLVGTGN